MQKIQTIERVSKLLALFSINRPRLGIAEISRELNLAKGTVQGLVRTLADEGFLTQDEETRKYQLGARLYELGVIFGKSFDVNQKAQVLVAEIAKRQKLTVRIGIWDHGSVLITLTADAVTGAVGNFTLRLPAYSTGLGKAILAFLEPQELDLYLELTKLDAYTPRTITDKETLIEDLKLTRERGYAINREEHWLRKGALAAPIFGRNNTLVAAIAFVSEIDRLLGAEQQQLTIELTETARVISELMGYTHSLNHC